VLHSSSSLVGSDWSDPALDKIGDNVNKCVAEVGQIVRFCAGLHKKEEKPE